MARIINIIVIIFTFLSGQLFGQVNLKPSIGLENEPDDNDSIPFPGVYVDFTKTFESTGLKVGDTIPHFKLYTSQSEVYDIENFLGHDKPCLLIEGSYTCDVFRSKLPLIDSLHNEYGSVVDIFIVYTAEAHPDSPDVCPYMGMGWVPDTNKALAIGYRQPVTYGQRKMIVTDLLNDPRFPINVPVLIDGHQNRFWKTFNTAPNSAFLIRPDGIIYARHGWFDGFIGPDYNIRQDIDNLLKFISIEDKTHKKPAPHIIYQNHQLKISGLAEEESFNLKIFDMAGKTVFNGLFSDSPVDLPQLNQGIYCCQVIQKGLNWNLKILIAD